MNNNLILKSEKGLSLVEIIVATAMLVGLTLMTMTFLKNQNTVKNNIELKTDFNQYLYTFQKKLTLIRDSGLPSETQVCKKVFERAYTKAIVDAVNPANPLTINVTNAFEQIGGVTPADDGDYYHREYKVEAIEIHGDEDGLEVISEQGSKVTYEGLVVIQFKKPTDDDPVRVGAFEVLLSVDTDTGELERCAPLIFSAQEQGFGSEICQRMFGVDSIADGSTGECLVPLYTDCAEDDIGCKNSYLNASKADPTLRESPKSHMRVKDVMCDLVIRGSVPGKLYCTNT